MGLKLITAPQAEPITLAEAKSHLRITANDEDALIETWIKAAREYCEGYQNRAYITQTWELALDSFPNERIMKIPLPPLQSVTSIKYYDTEGTETVFPSDDYEVDTYSEPGRISLGYGKSWPSSILRPVNGVIITFTAGYGDTAADVSEKVKQAIKVLIGLLIMRRRLPKKTGGSGALSPEQFEKIKAILKHIEDGDRILEEIKKLLEKE
jgi:uncharacterized phiE125 gp8 family phage protein